METIGFRIVCARLLNDTVKSVRSSEIVWRLLGSSTVSESLDWTPRVQTARHALHKSLSGPIPLTH